MDTTPVGIEAARLMDVIAQDARLPDDAEITNVGLVVQIRVPQPDDVDHEVIHTGSTSDSRLIQVGLFTMGANIASSEEDF